jgi:hypothetical protein
LGIEPIQSVPQVPWSHPFVERLIRSLRTEYLDRLFYWNAEDLERKLAAFGCYFNAMRVHQGLGGDTPNERAGSPVGVVVDLADYRWQAYCHGLVQLPMPALELEERIVIETQPHG